MPDPPRQSIVEIARKAGVSPILVAYYLSGPPEHAGAIDAAASARIAAAIRSTGYVAASDHSTPPCHLLYLTAHPADPRTRQRVARAGALLRVRGASISVMEGVGAGEIAACRDLLRSGSATGLLIECEDDALPALRALAAEGYPVVALGPVAAESRLDVITPDDGNAIREAMLSLVDTGYEAFVLVSRSSDSNRDRRITVARDGLRALGISPDCIDTVYADHDPTEAATAILPTIARHDRPTAVIAGSDAGARGVLWACLAAGISIPGDVAVLGYGDTPEAAITHPPLSSIGPEGPEPDIAELLLSRLANPGQPGRHLIVPWRFVPRGSTGG